MNSDQLLAKIELLSSAKLPGEDAQMLLAPYGRKTRDEALKLDLNPRVSAVLVLLFLLDNEWHTVLIKRNDYKGVHSGQISFPGGKVEEQDTSLAQTALREANEEVGLAPQSLKLLRGITQLYIPPSRFLVHPFLAYSPTAPQLMPNPDEVAQILTPPLRVFDPKNIQRGKFESGYQHFTVTAPFYQVDEHKIWGATAMILAEVWSLVNSH